MEAKGISVVGVVGAGQMGSGIASWCALHGREVFLLDMSPELVRAAFVRIRECFTRDIAKGRATHRQAEAALSRIKPVLSYSDMASCELYIEAVPELPELKRSVYAELEGVASRGAIIATNTSGLSIDALARDMKYKDRFIGMHFFGPVQAMKLIEVIVGGETSDKTFDEVWQFALDVEKLPVKVARDSPGFIVNRVLFACFLEAVRIYEEGVASTEDIDKALKFGLNHPMGPFALMDLGGLDTFPHVCESLKTLDGSSRWDTPESVVKLVSEGKFGRKSGEGWYTYK